MIDMSLEGKCPDEFRCHDGSHGFNAIRDLHVIPVIASFISAIVSMLGAALILFAYCAYEDLRRKTAQKIVTLLALADIGTAVSLMLGSLNLLVYKHYRSDISEDKESSACLNFYITCQIQAFITLGFSISGYVWTALLAVHYLLLCTVDSSWTGRLMPLYNILAWTLPIIVSLPLLISGKFGYTPTYPTTCYISAYVAEHESSKATLSVEEEIVWAVQVACIIVTAACFVIIVAYIRCKRAILTQVQHVNKRMLAIPIAYLFLRVWDAAQVGLGLTALKEPLACASHNLQVASFVISILQIVADTGQGWVNCILYVFLSTELRNRMFVHPYITFKQKFQTRRTQSTSHVDPDAPLIQPFTERSPSSRAIHREEGHTYVSRHTDMPDDSFVRRETTAEYFSAKDEQRSEYFSARSEQHSSVEVPT